MDRDWVACTAEGKAMVTWLDSSSREPAHRDMDTSWENQNGGQKIVDDHGQRKSL